MLPLVPFYRQANRGSGRRVTSLTAQTRALSPGPEPALPPKSGREVDPCSPEPCGGAAPGSRSLPFSPAPLPAQALLVLGLEEDPGDSFCASPLGPSPAQREQRTPPACLLLKGAVPLVRPMMRSGEGQPVPRGEAPSESGNATCSPGQRCPLVPGCSLATGFQQLSPIPVHQSTQISPTSKQGSCVKRAGEGCVWRGPPLTFRSCPQDRVASSSGWATEALFMTEGWGWSGSQTSLCSGRGGGCLHDLARPWGWGPQQPPN